MFSTSTYRAAADRGASAVRQGAQSLADRAYHWGSDAADMAQDAAGQVSRVAGKYYREGRKQAAAYESELEDLISEYPMEAVLIAAGVGFFIGWWMFGRRSTQRRRES